MVSGFPAVAYSTAIIALTTLLACAERPPQYQMIPAILDDDIVKVEALLNDTEHVDINWRAGGSGTSALMTAAGHNRLEIAKLLLDRGADPDLAEAEGMSPIFLAAHAGYEEMVRLLLAAGANPNSYETRHGFTTLATASSRGHVGIVKLLLAAGADRHVKAKNGYDAADMAWNSGHSEIYRILTTN